MSKKKTPPNEIIIPERISQKDILSGKIDCLIRIGERNKWSVGSIFILKSSHNSVPFTKIKITSSELARVQEIPLSVLNRCGYLSISDFQNQWENWFQDWTPEATAYLIKIALYEEPIIPKELPQDIEDLLA